MEEEDEILLFVLQLVALLYCSPAREYITDAHTPLCETRFRSFDSYYASMNPSKLLEYLRLSCSEFEALLASVFHDIEHPTTHRFPISPRYRLVVFLRYVSHGSSITSLSQEFSMGKTTVSNIVREVATAIVKNCFTSAFPPLRQADWHQIAHAFQTMHGYPRGLGCLDGKHVTMQAPANSGSDYFNYKGFNSIVLLAVCDADLRITLFDLGCKGRNSDSGIYNVSSMKHFIDRGDTLFPATATLGTVGDVPYHFLGDGGFALTERIMRPYPSNETSTDHRKAEFNRKYSGVRRLVENLFGTLANRFRILRRPIDLQIETTITVLLAIMCLHNALITQYGGGRVLNRFPPLAPSAPAAHLPARAVRSAKIYRDRMMDYMTS